MNSKLIHLLTVVVLFWSVSARAGSCLDDFPKAKHPYAKAPNGCGSLGMFGDNPQDLKDTWGRVNFRPACNAHDRCYYTLGSSDAGCNDNFWKDMRKACRDDLRIRVPAVYVPGTNIEVTPSYLIPPDPRELAACDQIAFTYFEGVRAGVAMGVFRDAQNMQRDYQSCVASLNDVPQPNAGPVAGRAYYMHNQYTGLYLDLAAIDGNPNDAEVRGWGFNGQANQVWIFESAGPRQWRLRNQWSGKYLDQALFAGNPNGAKVHIWELNGQQNQIWVFESTSPTKGRLRNAYTGKYLDGAIVQGNPNGAQVYGWEYNGQTNQIWVLQNN